MGFVSEINSDINLLAMHLAMILEQLMNWPELAESPRLHDDGWTINQRSIVPVTYSAVRRARYAWQLTEFGGRQGVRSKDAVSSRRVFWNI